MLNMKHGGHAPEPTPSETPFDYLLPDLPGDPGSLIPGDPATVVAGLKALGSAMVDNAPPGELNSTIPALYTYWGQFIDHDMTATRDSNGTADITGAVPAPVDPSVVIANVKNGRRPTFDLDSVYGNGPGFATCYQPDPGPADTAMYDGIRMRVGTNADGGSGVKIPPEEDLSRDLPRVGPLLQAGLITEDEIPEAVRASRSRDTQALIGDARNDENLIVAQFHLAFLRFHNKVVDAIEADPATYGLADADDAKRFEKAQELVRYHYQWLVVHDYLKTVTLPGIVDSILLGGVKHYKPLASGELYAPLEYAVAAYRFGHTMVRGGYDHNRNFGAAVAPNPAVRPFASFEQLFLFTGNGHVLHPIDITKSILSPFAGEPTLPFDWIIEWDRMSSKVDPNPGHFARKIDTHLVPALLNMVNEGDRSDGMPLRQLLRSLTQRNLLRGYVLSIPTGQAVAAAMGVDALSADELRAGNTDDVNSALDAGGFVEHTPLWYYLLKEAEVRANGNALGELGSRIVVETQIGLLKHDSASYLNKGWDPSQGVKLSNGDPIVTIRDFLAFADLPA